VKATIGGQRPCPPSAGTPTAENCHHMRRSRRARCRGWFTSALAPARRWRHLKTQQSKFSEDRRLLQIESRGWKYLASSRRYDGISGGFLGRRRSSFGATSGRPPNRIVRRESRGWERLGNRGASCTSSPRSTIRAHDRSAPWPSDRENQLELDSSQVADALPTNVSSEVNRTAAKSVQGSHGKPA